MKAVLVVAGLVAAFFLWRQWQDTTRRRELYECRLVADSGDRGGISECLTERFGWDKRDATDAFIGYLKERYPKK